jgi:hypothetical protein
MSSRLLGETEYSTPRRCLALVISAVGAELAEVEPALFFTATRTRTVVPMSTAWGTKLRPAAEIRSCAGLTEPFARTGGADAESLRAEGVTEVSPPKSQHRRARGPARRDNRNVRPGSNVTRGGLGFKVSSSVPWRAAWQETRDVAGTARCSFTAPSFGPRG